MRAFADQNWKVRIDNPFQVPKIDGEECQARLREAAKNLNRSLPAGTIRFSLDGHGGVTWVVAK